MTNRKADWPEWMRSGFEKVDKLAEADKLKAEEFFEHMSHAQDGDSTSLEKARDILTNDAGFTEAEFQMFSVFD